LHVIGLTGIWYKRVVRPKVLQTPAITQTVDADCEVHTFVSVDDWLDVIWMLKSFYASAQVRYRLFVHEMETLPDEAIGTLASHFPHAQIVLKNAADERASEALLELPTLARLRRQFRWAAKLTNVGIYAGRSKLMVIDASVLFFACPDALLARVSDSRHDAVSFCPDMQSEYLITRDEASDWFAIPLLPLVSSALVLAPAAAWRLDWFEEFAARLSNEGHRDADAETTLYALLGSRFGAELLPGEYAHDTEMPADIRICRRYAHSRACRFYSEGLRQLTRQGLLKT
jgi:hypothetical protein